MKRPAISDCRFPIVDWLKQTAAGLALALAAAGCVYPAHTPPPQAPAQVQPQAAGEYRPTGPGSEGEEVFLAGGEGIEVMVEGVGALPAQGGADIARDGALRDALRKAVEQGVGTLVSSETQVQNFQLLSDRIYSVSEGYVSSYRVIGERLDGALYRVNIRARVKLDRLESDLPAIGIIVLEQGRPRIAVLVKELENWEDFSVEDRMMAEEMTEAALLGVFARRNFPVVDYRVLQENLKKQQLKQILEGDTKAAALLGGKVGAEIFITGLAQRSSETKAAPYGGGEMLMHKMRLSVRAINVADAAVMAASNVVRELPFSEDEARREAVDSAAMDLMGSILRGWKRRENATVIVAANASFDRVQRLKSEILSKVRGVKTVLSRDLVGSTATLEVISETSSGEVIDGLSSRGISVPFDVTGFEGNRVEIRFKD